MISWTLAKRTAMGFVRRYKRGEYRKVTTTLFDHDGPRVGTCWIDVQHPHTVMEVLLVGEKMVTFADSQRMGVARFFTRVHDGHLILVGATPDYVPSKICY